MSSKRKNTPTKLAADEMLITTVEEACLLANGRTDCHMSELRCDDSDSSGSELNLHIVSGDADDDDDSDCEPPTKKQHLVDGADYSDSDTTTAEDLSAAASPPHRHSFVNHSNNNNSILTKPYPGSNQRKSMNHVLKRLNSKQDSERREEEGCTEEGRREEGHAEGDVIGSIKAVISSTDATVQQKQQQISEMIKELQRIRESLEHNETKVCFVSIPQTLTDCNVSKQVKFTYGSIILCSVRVVIFATNICSKGGCNFFFLNLDHIVTSKTFIMLRNPWFQKAFYFFVVFVNFIPIFPIYEHSGCNCYIMYFLFVKKFENDNFNRFKIAHQVFV